MFQRLGKVLDHLEEWLIAILMAGATLIIFVAVVHRFASGMPALQPYTQKINMSWAQELAIFMVIWVAKFGAAYGVREGTHVGVDVLVNRLGPRYRRILVTIGLLGGVLFTGVIGTLGAHYVWEIGHTDQTSEEMELPMWPIYLCIPLGSYLMCFRFLQVISTYLRTGALPHRDHGRVEGLDPSEGLDLDRIEANADIKPKSDPT
jgi:C4-dicarboxylate transporter DctQ subunit